MSPPNALTARLVDGDAPALPAWSADVADDFARCGRLRQVELDWFRERGVSGFTLCGYRVDPAAIGIAQFNLLYPEWPPVDFGFEVRRARVVFLRGKRFAFAGERGVDASETEPALIIPACDEDERFVDLVAWHPRSGRLASAWRRIGMLGDIASRDLDGALLVHADPLSWLRNCRRGVVIVHDSLARPALLGAGTLQASDIAHGEALQAMLREVRLPRIVVPAFPEERAAA